MSIWTAEIVSPGIGDGLDEENAFRPMIAEDYAVMSLSDVTGIVSPVAPDPYLIVVQIWCDGPVIQEIANDDRYLVLWQEQVDYAY